MKKQFYLLSLTLILVSCQKKQDWDCNCKYTPIGGTEESSTYHITSNKKRDASVTCTKYGQSLASNGKSSCELVGK